MLVPAESVHLNIVVERLNNDQSSVVFKALISEEKHSKLFMITVTSMTMFLERGFIHLYTIR